MTGGRSRAGCCCLEASKQLWFVTEFKQSSVFHGEQRMCGFLPRRAHDGSSRRQWGQSICTLGSTIEHGGLYTVNKLLPSREDAREAKQTEQGLKLNYGCKWACPRTTLVLRCRFADKPACIPRLNVLILTSDGC